MSTSIIILKKNNPKFISLERSTKVLINYFDYISDFDTKKMEPIVTSFNLNFALENN